MQAFLVILVGLMAAVGLGCLITALQRWLLRTRGSIPVAVVVPILGAEEDLEYTLRSACASLPYVSGGQSTLLIADFGADEESLALCRAFCADCPAARLCTGSELTGILRAGLGKHPQT